MSRKTLLPLPLIAALLLLSLLPLGRPNSTHAQTTIAVSGRQLLVNGAPFVVRGVNYKPTPYSGPSNWGDDWTLNPAVVEADLAKMQEMGANAIRVYVSYERLFNNWDGHDPSGDVVVAQELSRYQTVLSAARSRGIYIVMNYWLPYQTDYLNPTTRAWHKLRFRKIVNTFKSLSSYPTVLMWALGNENNFSGNLGPLSKAQLFDFYQETISEAKAQADTSHPYTVVLGDDLSINDTALTSRAPAVDIWSLNLYQTSQGYANIINSYALSKPLLLSEFGADAFDNTRGVVDELSQANFYRDRWGNYIRPNLSASDSTRKLLGGMVFEWNDEWWKAAGARDVHDNGGWSGNVPPDSFLNEEWFGLSTALPDGSSGPRAYRQAFTALKELWASASPTATRTRTRTPTATRTSTTGTGATATRTRTRTPTSGGALPTATRTRTATTQAACGTLNLARGKAATASSSENAGTTPNLAVDGSTTTRWSSAFSDPQWIRVDLGAVQSICRVRLRWEAAYGRSYRVEVSSDNVTWTPVRATTTGDGGVDDWSGLASSGRYVRVYGTQRATPYGYSLWELEVY